MHPFIDVGKPGTKVSVVTYVELISTNRSLTEKLKPQKHEVGDDLFLNFSVFFQMLNISDWENQALLNRDHRAQRVNEACGSYHQLFVKRKRWTASNPK